MQSTEQAGSIRQVDVAVSDMDRMTQQNAAMVEQTSAAARNLLEQADVLSDMIARFDYSEGSKPKVGQADSRLKLAIVANG
jgi:methyl-accepting chemotaxis protein